jgi:type IV pilus assembly protein PilY1
MRRKSNVLKYVSILISLLFFIESLPLSAQEMEDYCVVPPYVKRDVAPNIMILMDNSLDMLSPAYPDSYTPNAKNDNYAGYFKPQACYSYTSGKFKEQLKVVRMTIKNDEYGDSYEYTDTSCPPTAPFRGNLMNWVTTSKFDLLQKVIIGGNSESKIDNAHTLLSIGGTWNKEHNKCLFNVNNANLIITERVLNDCALIRTPPSAIAAIDNQPMNILVAQSSGWFEKVSSHIFQGMKNIIKFASNLWVSISIVSEA